MAFFSKALEKFKSGLERSRQKINDSLKTVLTLGRKIDEELLDELEEQLRKHRLVTLTVLFDNA